MIKSLFQRFKIMSGVVLSGIILPCLAIAAEEAAKVASSGDRFCL